MSKDVKFLPILKLDSFINDENLEIINEGKNASIKLKGYDSDIFIYDSNDLYSAQITDNSFKLLSYLHKQYGLLVGGDGCLKDAWDRAIMESYIIDKYDNNNVNGEDIAYEAFFKKYAAEEMIEFSELYMLSEDNINNLKQIIVENNNDYIIWATKLNKHLFNNLMEDINLYIDSKVISKDISFDAITNIKNGLLNSDTLDEKDKNELKEKYSILEKLLKNNEIKVIERKPIFKPNEEGLPF